MAEQVLNIISFTTTSFAISIHRHFQHQVALVKVHGLLELLPQLQLHQSWDSQCPRLSSQQFVKVKEVVASRWPPPAIQFLRTR